MPAFEFAALDAQGNTKKGVLEGDTARQIRQKLRDQGLIPLRVDAVLRPLSRNRRSRHFSLKTTDLALITRQLATLSRAGLAVESALQAMADQAQPPHIKGLLLAVRARITEGHSLAASLMDFPHVFPEFYRATVAAGEQSGHLDTVLERLADYVETRQQLRQKTLMALFYPLLLTVVALSVIIGLLTYVVPQVIQVFIHQKQQLPILTKILIQLSDFLKENGLSLFITLMALFFVIMGLMKKEIFKYRWHRFLLKLPIIGHLEQHLNAARFTRTLSILTAGGVPVLDALKITAQVMTNLPMRQAVSNAGEKVREGESLYQALTRSKLFPPLILHLIASGEAGGNLAEMLERAAINQEREVETRVNVLVGLFEPILILVMGGIVLTIVLAVLMPIFELNQLVK
ncbi:MAG: type secretion system inner membrane protein GspF [Pseudomonadota bacterium]|jgi:general secretion pathway protein F